MRNISEIIIHCSASEFGDAKAIDVWHRQRGWRMIGYHYVILNGYRMAHTDYSPEDDGVIESGRTEEDIGAHCLNHNSHSIGICLIGNHLFTQKQLFESLPELVFSLIRKYNLSINSVYGHYEFNSNKTCPNIDMKKYREFLREKWQEFIGK